MELWQGSWSLQKMWHTLTHIKENDEDAGLKLFICNASKSL
jgi:hypothetical protein